MNFLVSIATKLLTNLASWLFGKTLAWIHGRQQKANTEKEINQKLEVLKNTYKEAYDGTPVTPEQRKKINQAISDFLRGGSNGL